MSSNPKRRRKAVSKPSRNGVHHPPTPTVAEPDYPAPPISPPHLTPSGQVLIRLGDLTQRNYEALWPGYLPRGVVTVITGPQGSGKTTMLAAAAAVQTSGNPGGLWEGPDLSNVLWYTVEDDPRSQLFPRLAASGVNLQRVYLPDYDGAGKVRRKTQLPLDAQAIGDLAFQTDSRLVIIDPLTSYLAAGFPPNDPVAIRAVMESLLAVAAEHNLCILATLHPRKGRAGTPLEWVSGGAAWTQSARQVVLMDRHPDDADMRLISVLKPCSGHPCPAWKAQLRYDSGPPRLVLVEKTDVRPEELAELGDLGELMERADALEWLRLELVEERETGALFRRWQSQGYGTRLWWRCRRKLGVKVRRVGTQREQTTFLYLPGTTPPPP